MQEAIFSRCDWKCTSSIHTDREFCTLDLWHKEVEGNKIPKGAEGTWVLKGHVLKCQHPNAAYTIFLIDQSGSMANNSIKPTELEYRNKMNNMLGAAIEALINYCKKRTSTNPKDQCALIGYEEKATKIFENISISEIDSIKNFCFSNLKPEGNTLFINAFKEAKNILENINNRNEYIPVIILLSDGLDHEPENTINYLKNDFMKSEDIRNDGCKIFCIYFNRDNKNKGEETLKEIAKLGHTEKVYNSDSLFSLCNVFNEIADIVQTNYKLKLNKKI